ncbi:MAG: threonylcarbamoyl-AMP synthase [Candidatus Aenigmarchaeota archaeon]|nr:threonylcarbamoyl-AMP synthase [Candidatus Aenigmarchaeota archaeon]
MMPKENDPNAVREAVLCLKRGGVVIYPTETAYGMGVDATNARARRKIYRIKRRFAWKKLSLIVASNAMASRYIRLDSAAKKLMRSFMPGPLTIICDAKRSGNIGKDVAFRIPRQKFALRMVRAFGKPVTATSANLSGKSPVYEMNKIKRIFLNKADLIVDGGNLPRRAVSTIYDVRRGRILRKGPISRKDIARALER